LLAGADGPLRSKTPEDSDYVIICENTEGEFVQPGNFIRPESPGGVAIDTGVLLKRALNVSHITPFGLLDNDRRD
jgi:tartrate dehydrogenase/decarboxylase/D-malate dehydrogenase